VKVMRHKPTIAQVAEQAQVAASTVSRVLNGGYASPEVKTRVRQVIRDLGYSPSLTARNLKLGRTGIIGVVVETSQGAWFTQLLGGVEERLADEQTSLVLASLSPRGQYQPDAVWSWIREGRVDGLIFARPSTEEHALIEAAQSAGLPFACVSPEQDFPDVATFSCTNRAAGRELAYHLGELGHERVAFFGGPKRSLAMQDRLLGLGEGLLAQGLTLTTTQFADSSDSSEGVRHAKHWLSLSRTTAPTAVVLGNDALALAFMRTVQQQGVVIPDQVSVMGFEGLPEAELYWPGLTTMAEPIRQMGIDACEFVLEKLRSAPSLDLAGKDYAMRLVARESTGTVRAHPAASGIPQRATG
jgi:LacI family transcriptional regulator